MEGNVASPHIKDHYEVVGVEPGIVIARDGKSVDLRTISLERAHELHAQKFPFLKAVTKKPNPVVEPESTENLDNTDLGENTQEPGSASTTGTGKKTNNSKR